MTKETGIIMSGNHPKLIIAGKKTMTRRVIKDPRRPSRERDAFLSMAPGRPDIGDIERDLELSKNIKPNFPCPYGQVGDRLWVRETWAIKNCGNRVLLDKETWPEGFPIDRLEYPATDPAPMPPELADDSKTPYWWNKRPSIFMPRWASRLTLEITGLRAERLQEITPHDCLLEGVIEAGYIEMMEQTPTGLKHHSWASDKIIRFAKLWNELNAKRGYGWETNPWVWVISFRRLKDA